MRILAVGLILLTFSIAARAEEPTLESLTIDLQNAQAMRAVKQLQYQLAHYAEAGNWRAMLALYAGDAPSNSDLLRLPNSSSSGEVTADTLNVRLFLSPVITIGPRGTTAKGRWHELAMLGKFGESATWRGGIHEIDYVKTTDGWKIARDQYYPQFEGPYDEGWRSVADFVPMAPFHYNNPTRVGMPFETYTAEAEAALTAGQIAGQARRLLDESAIRNLQAAYGFYVDRRLWSDVADLFAEDATYQVSGSDMTKGRKGIIAAMDAQDGPEGLEKGVLNDHLQLMPVITFSPDGQSATARGFEVLALGRPDGRAHWGLRIFENEYVKENGTWKFQTVTIHPRFLSAYDQGWAQDAGNTQADSQYPHHTGPEPQFADHVPLAREGDTSLTELARMIRVAQAYDGAENVSNAYGYYIDEFRWDDTADLFATDGWKELSYIGNYIGRESVRGSLFARYGDQGRRAGFMAIHQKTQPYVTVAEDGRSAQIRLKLFQFNSSSSGPGSYIFGIYENQAKMEDGVWKIAGMDLDYVVLADYEGGWMAVEPGDSERYAPTPESVAIYPPDGELRGVTFAPFPEIAPMGFHFNNPVSGRAPEVKLDWRLSARP